MNSTELAALIYTARNATQEVWGPIKREQLPEEYPPKGHQNQLDDDEWKQKPNPIVVDNLAWQTYTIVLTNLLQMTVKESQVDETMDKLMERINKDEDKDKE